MKKLFIILVVVLLAATVWAQSPLKMSYQAVIRDASNNLVINAPVMIEVMIRRFEANGMPMGEHHHYTSTNANGLISIEIGEGLNLDDINWAQGPFFLQTTTQLSNGELIIGSGQLLSVPYALHAKTAESLTGFGEEDPIFSVWDRSSGILIAAAQVSDFETSVTNNTAVLANTAKNSYPSGDAAKLAAITGTNTGDNAPNTLYSGLVTNATHSGDVTGSGELTIANKVILTGTAPVSITGEPTVIASGAVAISIEEATTSTAGSMSAADKTKLDGLTSHTIGESYGGGIVFYVYDGGQHGLIAAPADLPDKLRWYAGSYTDVCTYASGVGGGFLNTTLILASQGIGDNHDYAARACISYSATVSGVTYGGWYLPSGLELNLMYGQKSLIGGFADSKYWSSAQAGSEIAWWRDFSNGNAHMSDKNGALCIRPIRAF